ncbi:hypothetical protein ILUMI_23931 [Ignelater luminosus]|uniref:Uncharacterized protein n=1 Tax=Ignelater luminosus TaxID=2038154 RepID=A0A8K0G1E2_IGNLU|nr:hypothetical protein ILUMI_23931 [Ignelater luminosus]
MLLEIEKNGQAIVIIGVYAPNEVNITESIEVEKISINEIKRTVRGVKNGKAPGPGNIPIELVKYGPDILLEMLADLFNDCMMKDDVDYMLRKLKEEYENWGMNVDMLKTEYLRIGEEQEDPDLQLRHIKRCEEYLGSIISNKGTSESDIK